MAGSGQGCPFAATSPSRCCKTLVLTHAPCATSPVQAQKHHSWPMCSMTASLRPLPVGTNSSARSRSGPGAREKSGQPRPILDLRCGSNSSGADGAISSSLGVSVERSSQGMPPSVTHSVGITTGGRSSGGFSFSCHACPSLR